MLIVVAAALFDAQGRVLVQRRPPGVRLAGLWEFPGGKVELGERVEDALRRELREELGIVAGALEPLAFSRELGLDLLLLLFRCAEWTGEPVALEADALAWLYPVELRSLAMPEPDLPLVDALIRRAG